MWGGRKCVKVGEISRLFNRRLHCSGPRYVCGTFIKSKVWMGKCLLAGSWQRQRRTPTVNSLSTTATMSLCIYCHCAKLTAAALPLRTKHRDFPSLPSTLHVARRCMIARSNETRGIVCFWENKHRKLPSGFACWANWGSIQFALHLYSLS